MTETEGKEAETEAEVELGIGGGAGGGITSMGRLEFLDDGFLWWLIWVVAERGLGG